MSSLPSRNKTLTITVKKHAKLDFPGFLYFVPNILSRIVEGDQEEIADLSSMPLLWDDEEEKVKEGKELKILTLNTVINETSSIISKNRS